VYGVSINIPAWIKELADYKTLDVLVCRDIHDAVIVRNWLEEQVPGLICTVLSVPLAQCYLVIGLGQIEHGGQPIVASDPKAE
jgi:hypothetical protein